MITTYWYMQPKGNWQHENRRVGSILIMLRVSGRRNAEVLLEGF